MSALLAADVKHAQFGHLENGLQRERRLTNARLAAKKYDTARYEAATKHAVKLSVVGVDARLIEGGDVFEWSGNVGRRGTAELLSTLA